MKNYLYLVVIPISILLSSCLRSATENSDITVFRYNESAGITSLDPAFAKAQSEIWACNQIYNGLIQLDDSLFEQPCIAKSWSISDDGLIYTFNLRTDVFFQESDLFGAKKTRPVVASDFVYSFSRILDEKLVSPGVWIFNNVSTINNKPAFIAINDTVFQITLTKPLPQFLGLLSMQYCSVVAKEVVKHYGQDYRKHPLGTGPYKFEDWDEGSSLVLLKNNNYFEKDTDGSSLPYIDAVSISLIKDKQSAFLEFSKGNLDFLSGIDPSYKDELLTPKGELSNKYKEKLDMASQPYLNTEYLGFLIDPNIQTGSPVKNKLVRQAINYGFDRVKMIRYLRNGVGTPGTRGFIPAGMPGYSTTNFYEYNPEKAKQLLAQAGYPAGKGLGEIKLSTNSAYLDLCEFMARQLEDLGFVIKVDVNPPATHKKLVADSEINFFRASWIADYADAENYLALFYSKNFSPSGPNTTHFSNKQFDLLYEKSLSEPNRIEREKLYRKMDEIIASESPVVVLFYDQVLRFTQKSISNMGSNPMNLLTLKKVKKLNPGVKPTSKNL